VTKLRLVAYRQLSKVAEAAGFRWVRREGSHNVFRNPEGRIVVIPDHGSQVIVRPPKTPTPDTQHPIAVGGTADGNSLKRSIRYGKD